MEAPPAHRNAPSEHSGVPHGLFGSGSAPRCLLRNAHASGSLRSPSGGRTEMLLRNIPVFRSAFFPKRPCYGLFFKTLDLQVRFARPPVGGGSFAPPCTPLSCPRKCGDRQAAIPLCGKSSLSEHAMDFPSALHIPKEAWSFLRTPPRPAAKRAASTRAATPLPPPASSFFLTARSSFRTSRRP